MTFGITAIGAVGSKETQKTLLGTSEESNSSAKTYGALFDTDTKLKEKMPVTAYMGSAIGNLLNGSQQPPQTSASAVRA